MKQLITILLILMSTHLQAQHTYTVSPDTTTGGLTYLGTITFADLQAEAAFGWMKAGAAAYQPDAAKTAQLQPLLGRKGIKAIVFLGTWCEDSQLLIPQLYAVFQKAGFPASQVTIYGTDRSKHVPGGQHTTFGITRVPTIILMQDGKELARITESVQVSLEADLLAQLQTAGR